MFAFIENNQTGTPIAQGDDTFFNVATNTYLQSTGLETPRSSGIGSGLSQINCELFDIGCQFQKAFVFLFVPTQGALNKFVLLYEDLKTVKPFGYITLIFEWRKNFNLNNASFEIPNLPFVNDIFTPIRSAMAAIFWLLFGVFLYNRLKTLEL